MLLQIDNLDFSYGRAQILYRVSLDVEQGQVFCVMGRNGVGKTTLLKNIMGLLLSQGGKIRLADQDITRTPPHQRARLGLNLVPQGRGIFPTLTVEENLRLGLEARSDGSKVIPDEVYDLFPMLHETRRRMGGDLSGGMQQQLAIGRALAGNPGVLLLDEPTEGIQPSIIKEIGAVMRKLITERNITIVLVEQYVDFVREFGDTYVIMNRGRIDHRGKASDLETVDVRKHLGV